MPSPSRQADGHRDPRGGNADEAATIAMWGGLNGAVRVSLNIADMWGGGPEKGSRLPEKRVRWGRAIIPNNFFLIIPLAVFV